MAVSGNGLGHIFNVVITATGNHIRMKHGEAVTFIAFLGSGAHSWTLKESKDGSDEQNLAVMDRLWKAPEDGSGAWIAVDQAASATYSATDVTNRQVAVTIRADQLSPGFDSLEMTATNVIAIVHGLREPAAPERLDSLVSL